jgi:hypothetical protein
MTQPKIDLKAEYDGRYNAGKCYNDITDLLRDVHQGVVEIAAERLPNRTPPFILADNEVYKLSVLNCDDPQRKPPSLGFLLSTIDNGNPFTGIEREWKFYIGLKDLKNTTHKLAPDLQTAFKGSRDRVYLAILLQAGFSPEQIAAKFADPAVRFFRKEVERLTDANTENTREQIVREERNDKHGLERARVKSAELSSQLQYLHFAIRALLMGKHLER